MAYVILNASAAYAPRGPDHDEEVDIANQSLGWASQLERTGAFREVTMDSAMGRRHGPFGTLTGPLHELVAAYQEATEAAGQDGILGILVGHGSGGMTSHGTRTTPLVDLGPSLMCRVTEYPPRGDTSGRASIIEVRAAIGESLCSGPTPPDGLRDVNLALWHISRLIATSGISEVRLLSCSTGMDSGPQLLRQLRGLWGGAVEVYGLNGFMVAADDDGDGEYEMRVISGAREMEAIDGGPPPFGGGAFESTGRRARLDRFEREMIRDVLFTRAPDHDTPVQWH